MRHLSPWGQEGPVELLLLGAHADDIEIGCGGAVLRWMREGRVARATWVVLSAGDDREKEARRSAAGFLAGLPEALVRVEEFRDGFFPYDGAGLKKLFEELKASTAPDVILTHDREDRHQDHRVVSDLTWQTFRDHLILEYEVPKFDGDLGRPNAYVELPDWAAEEKVRRLIEGFPSQLDRHWFSAATFAGLARLRGIECRSSSGYAEGFRCAKVVLS